MRKVAHGVVRFDREIGERILKLMELQCSAMRSAYQAIHKHGLQNNDVKVYVKKNYFPELNQRYVSDACSVASGISQEGALFGGKKSWKDLILGNLPKEQWKSKRNSILYSRGDASKGGNSNIRIVGNKVLINDPGKRGRWLEGNFYLPKKFKIDLSCYDVRLIYRNGKFEVKVGWNTVSPEKQMIIDGAIGIDCNPDGIAIVETDDKGNFINHTYEREQRIQFASKNKRDNDIRLLAKTVVNKAKELHKILVVEKLSFSKKKKGSRKFRRMKSNFIYKKMIESIKSRAEKKGVAVVEINPAFTSVLGQLKYQKMYSLNRHTSAGLVIARRGMGLLERQDFTVKSSLTKRNTLKLEARGVSIALSNKAFSWLEDKFLKPKVSVLTGLELAVEKYSTICSNVGGNPTGESFLITGQERNQRQGDERLPSELGKIVQVW
jgi:IS605 OrfB family transposase